MVKIDPVIQITKIKTGHFSWMRRLWYLKGKYSEADLSINIPFMVRKEVTTPRQ
jgi:hypothetical protein